MFTPVETAVGSLLLWKASDTLLFQTGNVLGISGMLRSVMKHRRWDRDVAFFVGMAIATGFANIFAPSTLPRYPATSISTVGSDVGTLLSLMLTGIMAGWGTKACGGCTSGHMLCGMGRLRARSALATAIFFPIAVATTHMSARYSLSSLRTEACPRSQTCSTPVWNVNWVTAGVWPVCFLGMLFLASFQGRSAVKLHHVLAGVTFGYGLLLSGMADPEKVRAFFALQLQPLDTSVWDPSLLMVVLFGLLPGIYRTITRGFSEPPRLTQKFNLPTSTMADVDVRFVLGAVAFGISWGLTGVCPGPALLRAFQQWPWGIAWTSGFTVGSFIIP